MKVDTLPQNYGLLNRPQGIALAIAAIVVIWRLVPVSPAIFILLTIAVLLFLGFRRPVWAMAALLISQFTITSYMVATPFGVSISLRLLILLITCLVLLRHLAQKQLSLGPMARRLIIPAVILLGLSVVANMVNIGFDSAFKDFRNMVTGIMIILFLPAVVRNMSELKILCGTSFIIITASALIGLMQHYNFLGMGEATLIPGILAEDLRVPGMAETELELAYVLSTALLVFVSLFLAKGVQLPNKKLLILSIMLIVPALYFTYTRSALLGLAVGLVALVIFMRTRIRWEIIFVVLLLGVLFIETSGVAEGRYLGGRGQLAQEESAYERKILFQAGTAIAMDNPVFGIGRGQFILVSPQYASRVDPDLIARQEEYWGYRTLGSQAVHNDFLSTWVSYGTLALAVYLWFFIVIFSNFFSAYRGSRNRFIKGLSLGLAAGLIVYVTNAFYHNLMSTVHLIWIMAGFSIVTTKLALEKERRNNTRRTLEQEVS
jgi:O-antigen ligase